MAACAAAGGGVDLAARDTATLGGLVATNAGGLRVIRHGATRAQLLGAEAVLADGRVLRRWTGLAKDNVGYDLPGLLAGSEGTLAVITAVLMRLVPPVTDPVVTVIGVPDVDAARAVLAHVRTHGVLVEAAEFFAADGLDLIRTASPGTRAPLTTPCPVYLTLELSGNTAEETAEMISRRTPDRPAGRARRRSAPRRPHRQGDRVRAPGRGEPARQRARCSGGGRRGRLRRGPHADHRLRRKHQRRTRRRTGQDRLDCP